MVMRSGFDNAQVAVRSAYTQAAGRWRQGARPMCKYGRGIPKESMR